MSSTVYSPCQSCQAPPNDGAFMEALGNIHSIETCGTVDGPGLRYILFLSGCPLRCQYCHNPDAQGRPRGELKSASDVLADVVRYKNFLRKGGLTISGGEPLMQPDFLHAVFKGAKEAGIHTALDTSGFLGYKASDELLENVDLVLLDIKSWNPSTYREVTGVDLSPTLEFADRLSDMGKPVWIRFVLVPGLTDAESNIDGLAQYVSTLENVERVEILPFHKMGEDKYKRLGLPYQLENTPTPSAEEVERARCIFARYGVKAI
ncbi:pyruvate formate-lyase-activating protein [Pelagicoccus sp. SDUM812003]|uniref:pyruvate formate-lyase-activating protein n=1 Tax=Pelagicoccus sp. SDUM812003 TaxID=3041267 RepID=UPI00280F7630|nr:pyruvate formate-lyase-activating protein [Pelagicoccus sp. SDUM812003]MDQ8205334.1 pyruvate formate-lyase-activating protein [Pelagicoccus sp. SDUM812003]